MAYQIDNASGCISPLRQKGLEQKTLQVRSGNAISDTLALSRLPEQHRKSAVMEHVSTLGNLSMFILGGLLFCSPLISKRAGPIVRAVGRVSPVKLSAARLQKLHKLLRDERAFQKILKQALYFNGVLYSLNLYETGYHSRQPSIVMAGMITSVVSTLGMIFPQRDIFWILASLKELFLNAGKMNDMANNNNMSHRREWNLKRLRQFTFRDMVKTGVQKGNLNRPSILGELADCGRFIRGDLRLAFSLDPWRQLKSEGRGLLSQKQPRPYLNALASQLSLVCLLLELPGLALHNISLQLMAVPFFFVSDLFWNHSIFMRARENKTDVDGSLVLAGVPLTLAGLPFQPNLTKKYFFLQGLCSVGMALSSQGVKLNSYRYDNYVETIQQLYQKTQKNPALTASQILRQLKQNPDLEKKLKKTMGKHRLSIFTGMLEQADKAKQEKGVSLHNFLTPITTSYK